MNVHHKLSGTQTLIHFATAGAGFHFIQQLGSVPGSSAFFAGASILQARQTLTDYIGYEPDSGYCSQAVAYDMAITAYQQAVRACQENEHEQHPIGFAVTAAIASTRLPRGDHRAHLCAISKDGIYYRHVPLEKGQGQDRRSHHDTQITRALTEILTAITTGCRDHRVDAHFTEHLLKRPHFLPNGRRTARSTQPGLVFPANFNPIHDGHWAACERAEALTGSTPTEFAIEIEPPNKPAIAISEVLRRITYVQRLEEKRTQGKPSRAITITRGEGTYLEKARRRPGSAIIIGADAALRLFDPIWGHDVDQMLAEFLTLKTHFYVQKRYVGGKVISAEDLPIPNRYRTLFTALPGRPINVSSTQLRQAQAA